MLGVAGGNFVLVLGGQCVAHQISDSVLNAILNATNGAPQKSMDKANSATLHLRDKDQWTGITAASQEGQEMPRKFRRNYRNLLNI
jgi:hypothetical protein